MAELSIPCRGGFSRPSRQLGREAKASPTLGFMASLVSLVAFRAEGDIMPLLGYGGALFPKDEVPLVRAWPMSIDPGQKVAVHVTYDATTCCYTMYPPNAVGVKYILRTGALWEGPIGKLDLEIRFRDYVDESCFDDYQRSHIKKELGFELGEFSSSGVDTILAWHLENIEPTGDLNLACIAGSSIRAQKRWEASEKVDAVKSGKDARQFNDPSYILFHR
jgi:hypothetical protein